MDRLCKAIRFMHKNKIYGKYLENIMFPRGGKIISSCVTGMRKGKGGRRVSRYLTAIHTCPTSPQPEAEQRDQNTMGSISALFDCTTESLLLQTARARQEISYLWQIIYRGIEFSGHWHSVLWTYLQMQLSYVNILLPTATQNGLLDKSTFPLLKGIWVTQLNLFIENITGK